MKKLQALALSLSAMLVLPVSALAAGADAGAVVTKSADNKKVAAVATVKVVADVVAVDAATRELVLKTLRGDELVLVAGEEVKNFAQIKTGDRLVVQYVESLVMALKKGTAGIRERVEGADAVKAPEGAKPGVAGARQVSVVADVVAVDAKRQDVTLKGAKRTVTLHVQDPAVFANIKVGDQVAATYTQALAVAVEPAK